ncbi:putative Glutaminyl cyclase [Leptomonas seymouri]|uniref:Putative Glutaminyl cyclase n=1 Tax=Leptomonas seymouri TaxID=5684 RepID=A0A0N1PBR2_LEPSE|nr:putative Glutaminyl cyclase [Leptomonas seymouri]|eukprot:KPI84033.1 putative Glutaminyl cyclase [Leptomonas seymouri]
MQCAHGVPRRPPRRKRPSLCGSLVRRCLPYSLFGRALHFKGTPARRCCVRALLGVLVLLLTLLICLLFHLFVVENATVSKHLHLRRTMVQPTVKEISVPLESASPEEVQAVKRSLRSLSPRTTGPVPRLRQNGFLSTYFDLEERALPPLTTSALNAWFAHNESHTGLAESVLLQHVGENTSATAAAHEQTEGKEFFKLLAFLYPPSQQQGYYREALNDILGFGTRVGGTKREPLLHHLLNEGLGRDYYNAEQHRYRSAPHLSQKGVELLEKAASAWPSSPDFTSSAAATADHQNDHNRQADHVAGWRWSLMWDNFSTAIPISVEGQGSPALVDLKTLVFQFPGGSQFRRKKTALSHPQDVFVGRRTNLSAIPEDYRAMMFFGESHLNVSEDAYVQETFIDEGITPAPGLYLPKLKQGKPGTKAEIHTPGRPVPLKPMLSFPVAEPVSRQPIQHAVYAAHWDSMLTSKFRFLGACDSAVPMVYLLRTIKNIAILTDVAEALTESYKAERVGPGDTLADGVAVPGLTTTFRRSTTEAEVRGRLARLLSPAHHALLFHYLFALPYTVGHNDPPAEADNTHYNYPHEIEVDVRRWLDWVQHLPALSIVFFDAEEAFKKWAGDDHTYGSRHLAQRWREFTTAMQTRYSGGPQSLFDTVDLFALYDLMGTAGTSFHNLYPTQSGIYYAALVQKEREKRQRAFRDTSSITAELLWRVIAQTHNEEGAKATTWTDKYVRQLGLSVDVAIAALSKQYVTNLLATPSSRPTVEALPRSWLLYGSPHEMLTLHRISLADFQSIYHDMGAVASARQYDSLNPTTVKSPDFDSYKSLQMLNTNIFFTPSHVALLRRASTDPVLEDDHLHWLDTQRVLHLISFPFPNSWHEESDDGRDIHDGTTVDLANVLWSTILELGHYWTGEEEDSA